MTTKQFIMWAVIIVPTVAFVLFVAWENRRQEKQKQVGKPNWGSE